MKGGFDSGAVFDCLCLVVVVVDPARNSMNRILEDRK